MLKFFVGVAPPFQSYLKLESLSSRIYKKKHAATPNISDGRSKSLNLRGRGVWIGGVNSTQGLAYETQGLQSHDGVVGLQGVLFDHTP